MCSSQCALSSFQCATGIISIWPYGWEFLERYHQTGRQNELREKVLSCAGYNKYLYVLERPSQQPGSGHDSKSISRYILFMNI